MIMKNLAIIKNARSLKRVANLIESKVRGHVACLSDYSVKSQEWVEGSIYRIIVTSNYHILTKTAIDLVWEIIDEYEKKYNSDCVYGTIQSAPYLTKSREWLHQPTIEIIVRVKED